MDLLKKELERKKKALQEAKLQKQQQDAGEASSRQTQQQHRWMKASQLRELQYEQEEIERQRKRQQQQQRQETTESIETTAKSLATTTEEENDGNDNHQIRKKKVKKKRKLEEIKHGHLTATTINTVDSITTADASKNIEQTNRQEKHQQVAAVVDDHHSFTLEAITNQLRALGLPVRLFGEGVDDDVRLQRLKKALSEQKESLEHLSEKDEYRLGRGHGIRNPFLQKDVGMDDDVTAAAAHEEELLLTTTASASRTAAAAAAMKSNNDNMATKKANEGDKMDTKETTKKDTHNFDDDDDEIKNDPHKRVYRYFKGLLKEWENDLARRSDEVKRSVAGKNETKTVKQCKDYIRPLFKLCKNRTIEDSMLQQLVKMVDYCEQNEFVKANDAYMDVAIGRAAWPIGVTMVGIHARSGRAKIESQNVAHVMNSELQRKYLTSVKRLLTYIQKKRTDVDPSKKVMN